MVTGSLKGTGSGGRFSGRHLINELRYTAVHCNEVEFEFGEVLSVMLLSLNP